MNYKFEYSKQFLKDLKLIEKGDDSKRIKQISKVIELIKINPQDKSLHYEFIKGAKNFQIRYLVGKKYRILIEIIIIDKIIIFKRVGRRENFY